MASTDSKTLYSINVAERFTNSAGEDKTKFREVAVGFSNRKGGLSFQLPKGLTLTADAEVVIFPIDAKDSD